MQTQDIKKLKQQLVAARQTISGLQNEVANFKHLVAHAQDSILICDGKGRHLYANAKACELTGFSPQELLVMDIRSLADADEKDQIVNYLHKLAEGESESYQTVLQCKNGQTLPATVTGTQIRWNGQAAYLMMLTDLSHLAKDTITIRKSETLMAAIIETATDMVAASDVNSRIIFANGPIRNFFYQLYGKVLEPPFRAFDIWPPDRTDFWQKACNKAAAVGRVRFEQRYFIKDQRRDIEWSMNAVPNEQGDIMGFGLVGRDITAHRVAEEALRTRETQLHQAQKMEAVGTLASGVAHEFNNALSIALGNIELALLDISADHPIRSYIDEAKTGVLRAKKVVRQLLDFSRKSDGRQKQVDLHTIVNNALGLLRASTPGHVEFHLNINACAPVVADAAHMHQMVVNLCANAAESMDNDGGVLTVTLEPVTLRTDQMPEGLILSPGQYAKLTIMDTGRGMNKACLDRIFEPFFTTKAPGCSTGLGLSVVHGIVKRHAGDILATSKVGQGSTFVIYLPTTEKTTLAAANFDTARISGNESILFVDDESKVAIVTTDQLERLGYQVELFTNPIKALERFKEAPDHFDLIITDIAMPKMTGDLLLQKARRVRAKIPVILVTGYSDKMDQQTAERLGCSYALKPLEQHQLAGMIREVLDK